MMPVHLSAPIGRFGAIALTQQSVSDSSFALIQIHHWETSDTLFRCAKFLYRIIK